MAQHTGNSQPVSRQTRLRALATDFDETLAHDGATASVALAALERLRRAGFVLFMVTGREIEDLSLVFPELALFDMIVAENGGLLYSPENKVSQRLAEPPPPALIELLIGKGVTPLAVGQVIVATCEPHHHAVLEAIKELGLELHVVFNRGAVMILPAGVNKATGLAAALQHFNVAPAEVVAIGDAENDHAMLDQCRFPVAVANALPALKDRARYITKEECGEGVAELIDLILAPGFVIP